MTPSKRLCDILLSAILLLVLAVPLGVLVVVVLVVEGRPVFYISERMKAPGRPFQLVKLRTMRPDPADAGVTGGDKSARIGPLHRLLRRSRADEIPQLWNVLRGDMSLVGPRPPLRRYVEDYPEIYGPVLRNRPGITGLATLAFHKHEERLLSACHDPAETEAVYRRRCIPRKGRLDLIYQKRQSLCVDLWLLAATLWRPLLQKRALPKNNSPD